ncbi:MAG: ABC transporter permease [Clostridiales bacterium]|nr:ABC transporter permease [Clostridiales bacterium]
MKTRKWLAYPYLLWMVGFILIPLILIVYYGLTSASGGFSLDNIALISKPINRGALWLSLEVSFVSTIVCLIMAYPLALILRNLKIKSSSFVVLVFILPMWMNSLLRTLAWQNILENTGILNQILNFFHLPTLSIINTPSAIMIGMVYNFLPFMILPIYNSLIKISDDVVNAAKDLGANNFQTFIRVIWPLSFPGVVSGVIMVFVPSLTTFAISDILGGSKVILIGNVIEQQFKIVNNWHTGSGLSLVLMFFILISMAVLAKYDKSENKAGGQVI